MGKKYSTKEFEYQMQVLSNLLIIFSKEQIRFNKSYTKKQKELLFNLFDDFMNDRIKETYKGVVGNLFLEE